MLKAEKEEILKSPDKIKPLTIIMELISSERNKIITEMLQEAIATLNLQVEAIVTQNIKLEVSTIINLQLEVIAAIKLLHKSVTITILKLLHKLEVIVIVTAVQMMVKPEMVAAMATISKTAEPILIRVQKILTNATEKTKTFQSLKLRNCSQVRKDKIS